MDGRTKRTLEQGGEAMVKPYPKLCSGKRNTGSLIKGSRTSALLAGMRMRERRSRRKRESRRGPEGEGKSRSLFRERAEIKGGTGKSAKKRRIDRGLGRTPERRDGVDAASVFARKKRRRKTLAGRRKQKGFQKVVINVRPQEGGRTV